MVMRWTMMWLNWSVAKINATLQLLDIYRLNWTLDTKLDTNYKLIWILIVLQH